MYKKHLVWLPFAIAAILTRKAYSSEELPIKYKPAIVEQSISQNQKNERLRLAIDLWRQQLKNLEADEDNEIKQNEIRFLVAQAYIGLKNYQQANLYLNRIGNSKRLSPNQLSLVQEKRGNIEQIKGNRDLAIELYQKSLSVGNSTSLSLLNNLVEALVKRCDENIFKANQSRTTEDADKYQVLIDRDRALARKYAKLALNLAQKLTQKKAINSVKPNAEEISSVISLINWSEKIGNLTNEQLIYGSKLLGGLPDSRIAVFILINWSKADVENQQDWLKKAVDMSNKINDSYATSYAQTELGKFYLDKGQLQEAIEAARQSQLLALSSSAYDSLFRAQSLAGKIYQQMQEEEKALDAYRGAITSIDELVKQDSDYSKTSQLADFKNDLEPIYRSSLKLLLNRPDPSQEQLQEAKNIFDKLRLAQLRRYFGDNCFEISDARRLKDGSHEFKHRTVSIDSIILDDKTYFILQLPDGRKFKSEIEIDNSQLTEIATQWRSELNKRNTRDFNKHSILFYNWIIKPFETEIERVNPEAIVFVHDGILRNLPMAALNDGEKFLAQKWASVASIGLEFAPQNSDKQEKLKALAFGLEKGSGEWSKLENASEEIEMVKEYIGGNIFINKEFTIDNLRQQVKHEKFNVLHFATHGYFSGDAETSFLLANDRKISALKLEDIFKQSKQNINLLVLSACETAVGSEESLLGLAGVAARSRVASTIGSLWQVDDENQLEIIEAFYQQLSNDPTNKATALQKAQIKQIEIAAHPQKWAALTLIGDL